MTLDILVLYSFYASIFLFLIIFIRSKILEKYFFYETIKPFFICFGITTFLFMFDRLSELMNTILEKQLDPLTIINLFALSLPFILALTVPMSVIYASIYSFGRMSVDNELTAAKATGIDIFKLTRLTMVFMIVMSFGMAYFNDFVLPESNHLLKRVLLKVAYKKPITAINPETFTTMNNLTI
ncbi:MAG: LptF/LptG family permease, partial [Candidatus Cloacimonetes bacterium]|nr:LptF/LptG family permease [Candidatus Cloacimonadota bacterium]